MVFSPECRTKKLNMIYTSMGSVCSFLYWEGADDWPQIRPRKIPESNKLFRPQQDDSTLERSLRSTPQ